MRPRPLRRFLLSVAFCLPLLETAASSEADPLATLRPGHPRLLATAETWPRLRALFASDPQYRALAEAEIAAARARLDAPPPVRKLEGIRLLHVSRRVLADAVSLSFAYHITGERAFLATAERNLAAAAAFSDWNPSHFLDVAEMTAALALGYDWLHDELSSETRAAIRAAIAEKGVRPGLDPGAKTNGWHTSSNNWNQVCLGGLTLGALAIAEDEPGLARRMLELLRRQHAPGLRPYAPDGVYPEGPNYWRYGTSYTVLTLAALKSALGSEELLPAPDSFFASARVQTLVLAPSGMPYSFADGRRDTEPDPLLFWFARRLGDPSLLTGQGRFYTPYNASSVTAETLRFRFFSLLDWQTPPPAVSSSWTAWQGAGPVPLAVFRGPDTPRGAFYLALKGGAPSDSHAHMDGGSFVLELDGIRWAHDLGMQEYHPLEQRGIRLFDSRAGGDRWKVFRYTNLAHSTLTLDGAPHVANGRVPLRDFSGDPASLGVTVDLTPALAPKITRAARRFAPRPDARGMSVIDELAGLRPGATVRWTLVTHAEVELGENSAVLREDGRELRLRFSSSAPGALRLSLAPASGPADFDAPAPGYRLLLAEFTAPESGALGFSADFAAP